MQPDSLIPDPYNPQAWNRYGYTFNNPVRYTDPTGHNVDCGLGQDCNSLVVDTITRKFKNVKFKNPEDFTLRELDIINDTLNKTLSAFGGNQKAFNNAFGDITFEMVDNLREGVGGNTVVEAGVIRLSHWSFQSQDVKDYFGSNAWTIAHEMGHLFDQRWANNDPAKYLSNIFVEVLNNGRCSHLTSNGCLGSNPRQYTPLWDIFGITTGNYNPADRQTTVYALEAGSVEDFAESYAMVILGDPNDRISESRERIIQIYINVTTSYWQ